MIIGVEHQSTLDKNMIIRILNYDAQLYINQVERGKEVVEISQSMLEWDYEKLRTNRMISVENYKMASILTHTDIKEERLTTTSLEKLNELTLNIFNINSEEDVLKIIY